MKVEFEREMGCISPAQVTQRRKSITLKRGLRKWSSSEDRALLKNVATFKDNGMPVDYKAVANAIKSRNSKQCRERYENSLKSNMRRGEWSDEETMLILDLIIEHGQNWAIITNKFKTRTYNSIKKKGMKLLGEILDRSCIAPGVRHKAKSQWTEKEVGSLLELHRQYRYRLDTISFLLRSGRSEAELERKLLQSCTCRSCVSRCEFICISMTASNSQFKEAWSKTKAQVVKSKLVNQQAEKQAKKVESEKADNMEDDIALEHVTKTIMSSKITDTTTSKKNEINDLVMSELAYFDNVAKNSVFKDTANTEPVKKLVARTNSSFMELQGFLEEISDQFLEKTSAQPSL